MKNYLKLLSNIKIADILLLIIATTLIFIANILMDINVQLRYVQKDISATSWHTFGSFVFDVDRDNQVWDKARYKRYNQKVKQMEEVAK